MSKQLKGNLLILLAAFIWGTAFLAQKDGGSIGTFTFNGTRNIIGGLSLLPVIFVLDKLRAKAASAKAADAPSELAADSSYAEQIANADLGWNKTVFIGGVLLGMVLFIASSLQQYGLLFTTIGKTGFITALYSLIVPIFSVILGKHVPKLTWVGVAVGAIVMIGSGVGGASASF